MNVKTILKWGGIMLSLPVLLLMLVALLLYVPPIQNWAVRQATAIVSDKTGMEITLERVNLRFPFDLRLRNFRILKPVGSLAQAKDTIVWAEEAIVSLRLKPLLDNKVEIGEFELSSINLNTINFISDIRIKGSAEKISLSGSDIDLSCKTIGLNKVSLDNARLLVALSDTAQKDTTEKENPWKIRVNELNINRTACTVRTPGDTTQVKVYLGKAQLAGGDADLRRSVYSVKRMDLSESGLYYDNNFVVRKEGLDPNHLDLQDVSIGMENILYHSPVIKADVKNVALKEKSGLQLNTLSGSVYMDSAEIKLPALVLRTPESSIDMALDMDKTAFAGKNPGRVNATIHASAGKRDLMLFLQPMPSSFKKQWPNYPLRIDGVVRGNMRHVKFHGLNVDLPTAFSIKADGSAKNLTDMNRLEGDFKVKAHTGDLSFLSAWTGTGRNKAFDIPGGMDFTGDVQIKGKRCQARIDAEEGGGKVRGDVFFDAGKMTYRTGLKAENLNIRHFLPQQDVSPFTGKIVLSGAGTDFLSPRTHVNIDAQVIKFDYGKYNLDNISLQARLKEGRANAVLHSDNPLVRGNMRLKGIFTKHNINSNVIADVDHIDFHRLKMSGTPLTASFKTYLNVRSDLRDSYVAKGVVNDIVVNDDGTVLRPETINLDALTRRDTTNVVVDCGDFNLVLQGKGGYKSLLSQANRLLSEARNQYQRKEINEARFREEMPEMAFVLSSGRNNFFMRVLNRMGCQIGGANIDLGFSPVSGLNGNMRVDSLVVSGVQLDTVRLSIASLGDTITYRGQVRNNQFNPQYTFNALFDGGVNRKGTVLRTKFFDGKDVLGIDLNLAAELDSAGLKGRILGDEVLLGYKRFKVNPDNYLFLGNDHRLSADMMLLANDGMGIQVYTNDGNISALQDVTLSLNKFDLHRVFSTLPYLPDVSGVMNGDFHLIQTSEELSVSSSVSVADLYYQKSKMGNLSTEFVYMPKSDGSHFVDGLLYQDHKEVATITGTADKHGFLDAEVNMERFPLNLINGFVPERIVGLEGHAEGKLSMRGKPSQPQVDGEVYLDSTYLVSVPYGLRLKFANDPVTIKRSKLLFENFEVLASNENSLVVSGFYDFSDLRRMNMDVRIRGRNIEIINAKENPRSAVYGEAFVDLFATIKGELDNLNMRGRLNVLGNTDMTYVMRDSELSMDNQMEELVKFTSFGDSAVQVVNRPQLKGFNMGVSLAVDESAHIVCMFNPEHSNFIDLMGGGDLMMIYDMADGLRLTGRYTLNNGQMKYSLPIIPLKTFDIQEGSYIQFNGDVRNPDLHITATEETKATVSEETGEGKTVEFVTGVRLSQSLSKPSIEFVIESPNDIAIQDELNTMSKEERGKIAIALLASGMYLPTGNLNSFSMNSALTSFLNSEINNISGTALRSMGLDLGMTVDNSATSEGIVRTDYNFQFSKRLLNNRLRIIVGGRVSTGENAYLYNDNNFFNNVELQYRLNEKSSQYLRLFYYNNKYDWLEGLIGEYGIGYTWKRKLEHFNEVFKLRNTSEPTPPVKISTKDSVKVENNVNK